MDLGKLKHRVTILQLAAGADAIGQPTQNWITLAMVWANVRNLSGVESIKAGAQTAVAQASVRLRYRTDVTTAMRVVHGATVYEITAVLPDEERRDHVDLACKAIT